MVQYSPVAGHRDNSFLESFNRKAVEMCLPVTGSLELTASCNLKCVHCYLGAAGPRDNNNTSTEMSLDRILALLDEITEAGCLRFLITGGEPLSRKDFPEIYRHAKARGLLVTIFTNGTLITEKIADIFKDLPPQTIEISLYGATEETYEKITRVKGSFSNCLKGIERLLQRNINVQLKTVLMTLNEHEFYSMEKIAEKYGVKFRFDAAIFPGLDGDKSPLALRVQPREAVEKEFSDNQRSRHWRQYFERVRNFAQTDRLYTCGAGTISFHVDSRGGLSPCLMLPDPGYYLSNGSFIDGWDTISKTIRAKKARADFICTECPKRSLCGYCPAFFKLEGGAEQHYSGYLCAIGESRFQKLTPEEALDGTS
ncbi:MAG: radical SAM protein [Thermodesulfovibrionales bacterium]